ncbi:MAG TPA: N-acetylmuramoyl-L-alanine amidase [Chloroflexi bacterium]|nr:N-acetylmuramoyl-L-alanine amidase [Chloroflexota bacterium]
MRTALVRLFLIGSVCVALLALARYHYRCGREETSAPLILTRSLGASQAVGKSLYVISRAEWGAREPVVDGSVEGRYDPETNAGGWFIYDEPLDEALNTIVIHHSALPLSDGPREIQGQHMRRKGYADMGYHFVIDAAGRIYEGRPLAARGAHTGGHNTGTVGVVLLGNFERQMPTDPQIESLKSLCRFLVDRYAITHLAGHRDFQPEVTVCPGLNLAQLLPGLAREVGLIFGTGGYVGMPESP